jgi:hypothetical protein
MDFIKALKVVKGEREEFLLFKLSKRVVKYIIKV